MPHAVPSTLLRLVRSSAITALDLVLPPGCPACDVRVGEARQLCSACFTRAGFIRAPMCRRCGVPFPSIDAAGPDAFCVPCTRTPPPWREARAALAYDEWSRRLLLPLKYNDRTEHAAVLGRWMHRAGADLLAAADLLVPVPLHRSRLRSRRYNQAALLAYAVGRRSGTAVSPDALLRRLPTPKLALLSPAERRSALADAITVRPSRRDRLRGRRIVLVDDILTTGTTLSHCAQAILDAEAASVDVLVAARTETPHSWWNDVSEPDRPVPPALPSLV